MSITITKTITDDQLRCLSNDLVGFPNDIAAMTADLQRRINWAVDHKVAQCVRRIVEQQSGLLGPMRPSDTAEAAKRIAAHPDFVTRDARDASDAAAGRGA